MPESSNSLTYNLRSNSGQALVFGSAIMTFMSILIVGLVFFTASSSLAMYYQSKLMQAAEAGARYGVESSEWLGVRRPQYTDADLSNDAATVVNAVLGQMSMPAAGTITTRRTTVAGQRVVNVSFSAGGLSLITNGVLPASLGLDINASVPFQPGPTGVLGINFQQPGGNPPVRGMYFPSYGAGSNIFGPGGVPSASRLGVNHYPYWQAGVRVNDPLRGAFQNHETGGTFVSY